MRVIGGRSRGRRLPATLPPAVRPTSDRVRESIFDILGSMGGVEGAQVLDLFCGSGALGIEALSRGAASATFVDNDRSALEAVRRNLNAVGMSGDPTTLVRSTLPRWLEGAPSFDLALCDPPYSFSAWDELLASLQVETAVLESGSALVVPDRWAVARERHYGGTLITVVRHTSAQSPAEAVVAP